MVCLMSGVSMQGVELGRRLFGRSRSGLCGACGCDLTCDLTCRAQRSRAVLYLHLGGPRWWVGHELQMGPECMFLLSSVPLCKVQCGSCLGRLRSQDPASPPMKPAHAPAGHPGSSEAFWLLMSSPERPAFKAHTQHLSHTTSRSTFHPGQSFLACQVTSAGSRGGGPLQSPGGSIPFCRHKNEETWASIGAL